MSRHRVYCLLVSTCLSGCALAMAGVVAVCLLVLTALHEPASRRIPPAHSSPSPPPPWLPDQAPAAAASCIPREQCCRVCGRGKACGNGCINERLTCHRPKGCACDAEEVCA